MSRNGAKLGFRAVPSGNTDVTDVAQDFMSAAGLCVRVRVVFDSWRFLDGCPGLPQLVVDLKVLLQAL